MQNNTRREGLSSKIKTLECGLFLLEDRQLLLNTKIPREISTWIFQTHRNFALFEGNKPHSGVLISEPSPNPLLVFTINKT
jgi:hypothetical protein